MNPKKHLISPLWALLALLIGLVALTAGVGALPRTHAAVPATVTSISPHSGPIAGGTNVVITGTNFTGTVCPGAGVKFGGTNVVGACTVTATQITATAPAHSASTVDIIVDNGQGAGPSSPTAADQFTYFDGPIVYALNLTSGSPGGGTSVVITGVGFTGVACPAGVTFGGVAASSCAPGGDTSITATSPAGTAGTTVDVRVTVASVSSPITADDRFTYTGAMPVVSSVYPNVGPVSGLVGVTITGFNLGNPTMVTFGNVLYQAAVTFQSPTLLIVNAPPHPLGIVDVQVTTAYGTSSITLADRFTYGGVSGIPVIYSVNPAFGPTTGMTYFTITGANFTGTNLHGGVTFGGTPVTWFSVVNDGTITGYTPAHTPGIVDVQVTNNFGTSALTFADRFTYGGFSGLPVIYGVNPGSGPTSGLTYFTITGANFTGVNLYGGVAFGGVSVANYMVVNDGTITGYTPAHAAGLVQVTVTNAVGTSLDNGNARFTYTGLSPIVSSISPTTGPATGGTTVVITGSGFTGATSVSFGSTGTTSLTVNSDGQITVTSPAHSAGTVNVFVTVGTVTSPEVGTADNFTYTNTGAHTTYSLSFRWTIVVWFGAEGANIESALKGTLTPGDSLTNNVFSVVTAVLSWNASAQGWLAFYPSGIGVPGANDFTTLTRYVAYWVAVTTTTNWTVATP